MGTYIVKNLEANLHAVNKLHIEQLLDQSGITFDIKTTICPKASSIAQADHYLLCRKLLLMTMVALSTVSYTATIVKSSRGFRRCCNFIELVSKTDQSVWHLRDGIIDGREFLIYDPDIVGHILLEVLIGHDSR